MPETAAKYQIRFYFTTAGEREVAGAQFRLGMRIDGTPWPETAGSSDPGRDHSPDVAHYCDQGRVPIPLWSQDVALERSVWRPRSSLCPLPGCGSGSESGGGGQALSPAQSPEVSSCVGSCSAGSDVKHKPNKKRKHENDISGSVLRRVWGRGRGIFICFMIYTLLLYHKHHQGMFLECQG